VEKSFRHYKVIETEGISAKQLQDILNKATHDDFQEKQIDFVVGTKIILGYESILNDKGRAEARSQTLLKPSTNAMSSSSY